MQFKSLLLAVTAATSVFALPTLDLLSGGKNGNKVPGYPWGIPGCLNDAQAAFVLKQFKSILTNPDRGAAVQTANILLSDKYVETSDSINVLAGQPVSKPYLYLYSPKKRLTN